jgi:hypothetical protein
MQTTQGAIGFVKYKPGPLQEVNWFGGVFRVWEDQVAIVDFLRDGRHNVEVFGPGRHNLPRSWLSAKDVKLTILSTGEQAFELKETFEHEVQLAHKPKVSIPVAATLRFRLINQPAVIKAALDQQLARNEETLENLNDLLAQYARDAFRAVCQSTNLRLLQVPDGKRPFGDAVKSYLDIDGQVRRNLAIEITAVHIESLTLSAIPLPVPPAADFISYRGPLELAPNCRLASDGPGTPSKLRFEVMRDQLALLQIEGRTVSLAPGLHDMRQAPLSDAGTEVIVLCLAHRDLAMDVEVPYVFHFMDGTSGERNITASVVLRYHISSSHAGVITFDTADQWLGQLERDMQEGCRRILSRAPVPSLRSNTDISKFLRDGLLETQPFEKTLGVHIVSAHITEIRNIPIDIPIPIPEDRRLVSIVALGALIDPGDMYVQVPLGQVALLQLGDEIRLLPAGSHQKTIIESTTGDINIHSQVKLFDTENIPLTLTHTFKPILPLPEGAAALPISLTVTVQYELDLSAPDDPDSLDKMNRIPAIKNRWQESLERIVQGVVEGACLDEGPALLRGDTRALGEEVKRRIAAGLAAYGLRVTIVDVTNLETPPELYEAVMLHHQQNLLTWALIAEERRKLISALADAEAQHEWAARIPALTLPLLLKNAPDTLREFLNNSLVPVGFMADRGAEGEQIAKAVEAIKKLIDTSPGGTPPPALTSGQDIDLSLKSQVERGDGIISAIQEQYAAALPTGAQTRSIASSLPTILLEHIEEANRRTGVNVLIKGGDIVIVIKVPDKGRLRLLLRDLDDYPDVEPMLVEGSMCPIDGEEQKNRPSLRSLADWHPGSTILDVVEEAQRLGENWGFPPPA